MHSANDVTSQIHNNAKIIAHFAGLIYKNDIPI